MQVPLEIAFHNIEGPPWAERMIRTKVAKLERIYQRLTACRVRVDRRGNARMPPVVRIELGIPGRPDLVISHEPDHLRQKFRAPDLRNAINEAFRIAEDQLAKLKSERQDRTKAGHHDTEHQLVGRVAEIDQARDFGFVMTKDGSLLYFHRNSVLVGDFDALKPGDEVSYVEEMGDTGPAAVKVRLKRSA